MVAASLAVLGPVANAQNGKLAYMCRKIVAVGDGGRYKGTDCRVSPQSGPTSGNINDPFAMRGPGIQYICGPVPDGGPLGNVSHAGKTLNVYGYSCSTNVKE